MPETKKIKIEIDGKKFICQEGISILDAADQKGIEIPSLCYHPDFCAKGNCRVCVVEVIGKKRLVTACAMKAEEGMKILTDSERVKKARNLNLELIFAEHIEKCGDCIWKFQCKLLHYAKKYKILLTAFKDRKGRRKIFKFADAVEIDGSQCIDCRNCIEACAVQKINYLELKDKNIRQEVGPVRKKGFHCILCGQCAVHCPVSSAQEQQHYKDVEAAMNDKTKTVVVQFAPSIRASIGEDFGLPHGSLVTGQVVAALRKLGFKYVFDVSFAADVTTIVEAEELIERIKLKGKLPMITSCCPGWVNYVEFYHPELIPNLTTARSPQIHGGGIAKTYFAEKSKIDPKSMVVVSIMPCTAKKHEVRRPEMKINDLFPVDFVLTTRELSFMLKKNGIDLGKMKEGKADDPMGEYSGGGVIFGGSGGVMESALRTAHSYLCGDKKTGACKDKIDFKEVRGMSGVKEAEVMVGGSKLSVAVVNGIGNILPVIKNLDKYQYIEVMACPGGCIGGGGQPIPTTKAIREKRMAALYSLDKSKKMRKSFENKGANEIIAWLRNKGHTFEHSVLHTSFKKMKKY